MPNPNLLYSVDVTTGLPKRRTGSGAPPPPPPPTFTLGVTEPSQVFSDVGIIRAFPTTTINGDITLSGTQQLLDTIVNGRITVTGGTPFIENCWIRGAVAGYPSGTERWLILCNSGTLTTIRFCRIQPQTPTDATNGIGARNYIAHRCYVIDCTDSFSGYNSGGTGAANIKIEGCCSPWMVKWAPDVTNSRSETHNDSFQLQGNNSDPNDVIVEGNSFIGMYSTTKGTQLSPPYSNLACIMLTLASGRTQISATFKNNWFRRGVYTFNAGGGGVTNSHLVITGNRFERPGTVSPSITAALNIDSTYIRDDVSGNTYIDNGAPVPITFG